MMTKEAYYFSHDSNARQDPKVLEMISVYGPAGYGRYWMIVELLREQSNHTLNISGKYAFNALAMQLHCTPEEAKDFVMDCINEFRLFESDGEHFWSNSLVRRMAMREEVSQKRKKAAEKRWGKKGVASTIEEKENAKPMQLHSGVNANAMQGKEKKGKEIKEKDIKEQSDQQAEQFDIWWNLYGNKQGKTKCFAKYKSLLKKYPAERIEQGTHKYLEYRKSLAQANAFVPAMKMPLTFLNGEHFEDEYGALPLPAETQIKGAAGVDYSQYV